MSNVPAADAQRPTGRRPLGGLTGVVLACALLGVTATVGQHSHAGTVESPLACAVCATGHHSPIATAAVAPALISAPVIGLPIPVHPAEAPSPVCLDGYHSRAPPSA